MGWNFIDNSRIKVGHLKYNSIHLNDGGIKILASYFISKVLRPKTKPKKNKENFPDPLWKLAKALNSIVGDTGR